MNVDQYLRKVSKTIYDSGKRSEIKQELQDTFEDMINAYEERGMSREAAEAEAIRQMGDPEETGSLFNQVYLPAWDWKAALSTLIWALFTGILNLSGIFFGPIGTNENLILINMMGCFLIVLGIFWSAVELYYDMPFFYSWSTNWNGGGISNSLTFAGVGIALASRDWVQLFILYGVVTVVILIERAAILRQHYLKEQKYLYETCYALENFNFRGKVNLNGQIMKVQLPKGQTAVKDSLLIITGLKGFTLISLYLLLLPLRRCRVSNHTNCDCTAQKNESSFLHQLWHKVRNDHPAEQKQQNQYRQRVL